MFSAMSRRRTTLHRILLISVGIAALTTAFVLPHPHDDATPIHQCQARHAGTDLPAAILSAPIIQTRVIERFVPRTERIATAFVVRLPDSRAPPAIS